MCRWKRRTFVDDMKACDLFIRKERHHTEETYMAPKRLINLYRERSIDDGSHFDPRLDKYQSSTLRKKSSSRGKSVERNDSMKNERKVSGLEKVFVIYINFFIINFLLTSASTFQILKFFQCFT